MDDLAHRKQHPNYLLIWAYLFILTIVEVAVAFMSHLPRNVLLLALVFLAVWKAGLVALFFMHLKFESNRLRILAAAPLPLALILVLAVITEFRW
ncbi:MAG: cytochrome C oxidase subunit IV family protein [Gemmatimonadetes bacterium]|nr:cytochrome C oxidase subunit IV family protein [Gemmatimonadota bacterium]